VTKNKISGAVKFSYVRNIIIIAGCIFIILSISWYIFSYNSLQKPLQEVYSSDDDFKGIVVDVKYDGFLNRDVLIFNLKRVPEDSEKIAPFKYFLDYLVSLEENRRTFKEVLIQFRGKSKFKISGDAASKLVAQSHSRKIIDIALEFPSMVMTPGGKCPFIEPHGDPQYVIQKKAHNFEKFLQDWFLYDMSKDYKKDKKKTPKSEPTETIEKPAPPEEKGGIPEIPDTLPSKSPTGKTNVESPETPEIPAIEPERI